jgi:hypothetical protein
MVALGLWIYAYLLVLYGCSLYRGYGVLYAIDLSPLLPVFAIVDMIL